ncbi:MAG: hypothetical protein Q8910_01460, partial [Bacteroidota bacterium]|nr:hypothetical protein [Bacteroidota bacterium]
MKPYKLLLIYISVFLILFVLIFVFPSGGVKIGNFNFHFVKLDDFIHQKNPGYQDISFIMKQS